MPGPAQARKLEFRPRPSPGPTQTVNVWPRPGPARPGPQVSGPGPAYTRGPKMAQARPGPAVCRPRPARAGLGPKARPAQGTNRLQLPWCHAHVEKAVERKKQSQDAEHQPRRQQTSEEGTSSKRFFCIDRDVSGHLKKGHRAKGRKQMCSPRYRRQFVTAGLSLRDCWLKRRDSWLSLRYGVSYPAHISIIIATILYQRVQSFGYYLCSCAQEVLEEWKYVSNKHGPSMTLEKTQVVKVGQQRI
ncbi:hypothetical protein LSAT2_031202 [Lamellibrachia satsuma]|nr:hypothetical protein LSAT2_031202 [Lamellibrachia satsuma]